MDENSEITIDIDKLVDEDNLMTYREWLSYYLALTNMMSGMVYMPVNIIQYLIKLMVDKKVLVSPKDEANYNNLRNELIKIYPMYCMNDISRLLKQ